jgi:hypothetical protein
MLMAEQKMSKEEQIGFHKGSLDTLIKERQELYRLLTIVDALLKAHVQALSQLGVKITKREEQKLEKKL